MPPVECSPCDATGVLALEEEGLGLAVLEAEDLAVAADVEFALLHIKSRQPCADLLRLSSRHWYLQMLSRR